MSQSLIQLLLAVRRGSSVVLSDDELPESISEQLLFEACDQLDDDLYNTLSERDLLWRAQTRVMSIAGYDHHHLISHLTTPEDVAQALLVHACKSDIKNKVSVR